MKLFTLLIVIILLISGWLLSEKSIILTGARIYLIVLLFDLILLINSARQFRNGKTEISQNEGGLKKKFTGIFECLIIVFGLIGLLSEVDILTTAGGMIWFGVIVVYALSGVIISSITGIPLKMGYGGWYIPRKKK